jgi:hypothetical protein
MWVVFPSREEALHGGNTWIRKKSVADSGINVDGISSTLSVLA